MKKAFLYRAYPTKHQEQILLQQINACRRLYNTALEQRKNTYQKKKIALNYYDQAKQLKECRESDPELMQVNYSMLQNVLRQLQKTYAAFFRRIQKGEKAGFPRFKAQNRFTSMTYSKYQDGCRITKGRLKLQNVGLLKVKWHRELQGVVKTVTVQHHNGKWSVVFSCEIKETSLVTPQTCVGLDVGLHSFVATSDHRLVENPRILRKAERELKIQQRIVSKRKLRGSNRKKAVGLLAKKHEKVKHTRKDFLHKLSRQLVDHYDQFFVEKLNVKAMVQNKYLSKSIADASWTMFLQFLTYKAEEAGKQVVRVNPRNTSQECSGCGQIVTKGLSVRTHHCPHCGLQIDRDINSAINIKRRGHRLWLESKVA